MGDMTIEEARAIIGAREGLVDFMHEAHRDAYERHPGLSTEDIAIEVMMEQAARVAELDSARLALVARVERLEATPPPHTVAALLAAIAEARKEAKGDAQKGREETEDPGDIEHAEGRADGLDAAADLIRATLAPSPLDGVVAEVCALLPREYPEDPHGLPVLRARRKLDAALADLGEGDALGARVSIVDAMADLLAGMLAADAPPAAPIGPRCRHCRAALGAEHTKDCVLRWKEVAEDEHETTVSAKACDAPATKEPDK